jgi:hypothetical protein
MVWTLERQVSASLYMLSHPVCVFVRLVRVLETFLSRTTVQIDSLVPSYPCSKANAIRDAYQSVPAWTNHLDDNRDLKARLDATLGTAGLQDWATWCEWLSKLKFRFPLNVFQMITFSTLFLQGLAMDILSLAMQAGLAYQRKTPRRCLL